MKRNEFISQLTNELNKRKIADAAEIVTEYDQHFAFKLADGFSEEEIAAKLGLPAELATQFEISSAKPHSFKALAVIHLSFAWLGFGLLFILLSLFGIVIIASSLAFTALAVCLIFKLNIPSLIPSMPYFPALLFGISCAALSILLAVGFIQFAGTLRQSVLVFKRYASNIMAAVTGTPILPPLSMSASFSAKVRRRLRTLFRIFVTIFAVFFVLAFIISTLTSGNFQFWHAWGWFGYGN